MCRMNYMNISNPLVEPIFEMLRASHIAVTEHAIIKKLTARNEAFANIERDNSTLALFKKHFLVMNALYQLQDKIVSEGYRLTISPLEIQLLEVNSNKTNKSELKKHETPLRDYYLDWDNFTNTSSKEVEKLLKGFWQGYVANDKRYWALQTLGLSPDADKDEVKLSYRRLAALYHPDKGGEPAKFTVVREAYEILMRCY